MKIFNLFQLFNLTINLILTNKLLLILYIPFKSMKFVMIMKCLISLNIKCVKNVICRFK